MQLLGIGTCAGDLAFTKYTQRRVGVQPRDPTARQLRMLGISTLGLLVTYTQLGRRAWPEAGGYTLQEEESTSQT